MTIEEAISKLAYYIHSDRLTEAPSDDACRMAIKALRAQQEQPKVVHGRWIYNTDDFSPAKRCTVCGYNKPIAADDGIGREPENYCPNCGAKMDGTCRGGDNNA